MGSRGVYQPPSTTNVVRPPTQVLTHDSVTVAVDGVIYFSIKDALRVVIAVADYRYRERGCARERMVYERDRERERERMNE